jgi:hypothetical protein
MRGVSPDCAKLPRSGTRASVGRRRSIRIALLVALCVGAVAGCGSSSASTTSSYAECLGTPIPADGGEIVALAIDGASCSAGETVESAVIGALDHGGKADGSVVSIDGWRCASYTGIDQTTCTDGPATLYAQYSLS